jgi:hypothetical protein
MDMNSRRRVEAARYTLLRRLAPAFRHRMIGGLHPLELIAETADQLLQAADPDLATVHENLCKIKNLSRAAVLLCTSLTGWLTPEDGSVTMLGEGIDECVALLNTDFAVRGLAIRNEARETGVDLPSAALHNVLTASLIAAADNAPGPADLVLSAEVSQRHALLSFRICASDRVADFPDAAPYHRIEWDDVDALAQAESVALSHQGDAVSMRIPLAGLR